MLLRIYMAVVTARWRPLRCAGFGLLSLAFLLGSSPQFGVRKAHLVVGTLALAGGAAAAPLPPSVLAAAAPLSLLALVAVLGLVAACDPDDSTGHRGGAEGFTGERWRRCTLPCRRRERRRRPPPPPTLRPQASTARTRSRR